MKILIVDDETEILKTLERHCQLNSLPVVTASSALAALDLHNKHLFPVVLTDIRMPEMNGVELLRALKKIHPACIVYVMTGYGSMDYLVECLDAGAADFFHKPFSDLKFVSDVLMGALKRADRWKKELVAKKAVGSR